ncbi:MAG TPA: LacI family DNA-binding transcriptional regulator, partial [Erysipelothrix sp.]|nr:LacI family DNA-binding transcriptional regulator [Erysipelothrix sp.]
MSSMSDVAKKAGVGVSTVSKVLNNYDNISQETRDRVMEAVEELNYVPNAVASALSSKKSKR